MRSATIAGGVLPGFRGLLEDPAHPKAIRILLTAAWADDHARRLRCGPSGRTQGVREWHSSKQPLRTELPNFEHQFRISDLRTISRGARQ